MHTWRKASVMMKSPIALTIGNFDGVHLGHQAILARLKANANRLSLPACAMIFEPQPCEFFMPDHAPARLTSLRQKLGYLIQTGIDCVYVCRFNAEFSRTSPEQFIADILQRQLSVHWLLVGEDFRFGARRAGDISMLRAHSSAHGFSVDVMSSIMLDGKRVSSTAIRQALTFGDLETARKLLGRPYCIGGRVVDGDKIGKKIGFPTANIQLKQNRPPLTGIFVVSVRGALASSPTQPLPAVASLGVRPTTHKNGAPVLEVHLLDFNQNIYGQYLQVEFLHKLRDEEKFTDLTALIRQIERDVAQTKDYFMASPLHSSGMLSTV